MKQTTKRAGGIALLLAGITAVSVGITAITGNVGRKTDDLRVVTTVYPLYVAVQNIAGELPGVTVENLTGAATGCLHDYQLSPANRISLEQASLVLLNGAGAETFLADVLPQLRAQIVDTSEGIPLLAGEEHEQEEDHDHEHEHDHSTNEHIWTSPSRYAKQVKAVMAALAAADPAHAEVYAANGRSYLDKIAAAEQRLQAAAAALNGRSCSLFHDSLVYLAEDLGLQVAAVLTVGEESGVPAGDLAAAERLAAADPTMLILYDSQYAVRYNSVDRQVPAAQVLALDTGVKGSGRPDDWLTAMASTAEWLECVGRASDGKP